MDEDVGQSVRWRSIRNKLAIAFVLVSVLPMMAGAAVVARLITAAHDRTVAAWLGQTAAMIVAAIERAEDKAFDVARFLAERPDATATDAPEATRLLDLLGYDLLALYSTVDGLLNASQPVQSIVPIPLTASSRLYQVTLPDRVVLAIAGAAPLPEPGAERFLIVGDWLDDRVAGDIGLVDSLDVRIYHRDAGNFGELFAFSDTASSGRVPQTVLAALEQGESSVFTSAPLLGDDRAVYLAVRDEARQLIAVVLCGLRAGAAPAGLLSEAALFTALFLSGMVLSVLSAVPVAAGFTRRITRLRAGVRAVREGAYDHRIALPGDDELTDLADAVNRLAERLEVARREEEDRRRRQRLAALGEMAMGLAHEVRNPLGIIKTSADLLRRRAKLVAADDKLLGYVADEVARIDRLISEFMTFARPQPPVLGPVRPAEVVARVAELSQAEAKRCGITLTIDDQAPGAVLNADENQLVQACLNLVLNAIQAMEVAGGGLTIAISAAATGAGARELRIAISDTGPGIAADVRERIFNPFFTTRASGTGLGLAKVHAIMRAHHGRVECDSVPGAGATFTLILPFPDPPPQGKSP
jgi:signal transduction histidine kinase